MAKLITCTALVLFTRFVSGHGMIHGDPDSSDKAAKRPEIPQHVVADLAAEGLIKAPRAFLDAVAKDAEAEDDTDGEADAADAADGAPPA